MAEEELGKQPGVERTYRDERIAVYWEPGRCIHVANCINALPNVFDPMRRPWVVLDADADEIAEAVMSCPTGALHFERFDGGEQEPLPERTSIMPYPNGPLFISGRIRIVDTDGNLVREDTRAALCRCGQSANKPFCDGTHRRIGFRAS